MSDPRRSIRTTIAISGKAYAAAVAGTGLEADLPPCATRTIGRGVQHVWVDLLVEDRVALEKRLEARGIALAVYGSTSDDRLNSRYCLAASDAIRRQVTRRRAGA